MLHLLVMCLLCFCRLPYYLYNNSKYLYSHTTNEKTIYFVPLYAVEHNVIFMLPISNSLLNPYFSRMFLRILPHWSVMQLLLPISTGILWDKNSMIVYCMN